MTRVQTALLELPDLCAPDEYIPSSAKLPPDEFVISRDKSGNALSRYGDMTWDRTPYHNSKGGKFVLHLAFWGDGVVTVQRNQLMIELRWLMFIQIYLKQGQLFSNSTLNGYLNLFRAIAQFCEIQNIRMQDVFADPRLLVESVGDRMSLANTLYRLIRFLAKLGSDAVGFSVVDTKAIRELKVLRARWMEDHKQYPPIPTRLYSKILFSLANELADFEMVADRILTLYEKCVQDPLFGRSKPHQYKVIKGLKITGQKLRPEFPALLLEYGLEQYWVDRSYVKSVDGLSTAITEAMTAAALQIQAYTGMRHNEVRALPFHSIDVVIRDVDGHQHYIVKGIVTKLTHGLVKRVQWATSKSGHDAIRFVQRIAFAIYKGRGEIPHADNDQLNLFYLFIAPNFPLYMPIRNMAALIGLNSVKLLRARLQPIIAEEDLCELENIDPHRAWRAEDDFQIGQPWVLTSHQLRRSLALYAQRSGLVSLPSLKRQLQHITQEMSAYYSRGSAFASDFIGSGHNEKHFGTEWQETQPVSQYLSYVAHVLLADSSDLFGVHPIWMSTRLRNNEGIVEFDRGVTMKRFQKGEMAYRETIIGGCVNTVECEKNPLDLFDVECLKTHCKNLVGSKQKLDRLVAAQRNLVAKLKKVDAKSPEYRHEKSTLRVFDSVLASVSNDADGSKER